MPEHQLLLHPGARLRQAGDAVRLGPDRGGLQLDGPMLQLMPVLHALQGGLWPEALPELVKDPGLIPLLYFLLSRLEQAGLICRCAVNGDTRLATLVPIAGKALPRVPPEPTAGRWRLSRFAYLRRDDEQLVLESPLSRGRLLLHSPAAGLLVLALGRPCNGVDLVGVSGLPPQPVDELLGLLAAGGFIDAEGAVESDAAKLWEFHDLLFHWRSRLGRSDQAYGGIYAFEGQIAPLPALKPAGAGAVIALPSAMTAPAPTAEGLQALMARRHSVRVHGQVAIDLTQLGHFLWRAARHIETLPTEHGELAVRPYPAGGALHELEIYLVVDRCTGLDHGLYHYRPGEHALQRMDDVKPATSGLLEQASATLSHAGRPQVLLVITARFQRLQWKYRSVVYALVLKHVGVLYQSFYLIATDMGLAPCAIGGADSELFAEASGLDPLVESSVGEFALGSLEAAVDATA
jgi:SagB-type dehydrogenase family enzyme